MDDPRLRFYLPNFRLEGEHNDCVVRAATAASQRPYPEVHEIFARHGRENGKGVGTKASLPAFAELGMRYVQCEHRFTHSWVPGHEFYSRKHGYGGWRDSHHSCVQRTDMTVAKFLRTHREGRFVVYVKGHAFAVINGQIWDMASHVRGRRYVEGYFTFAGSQA